MTTTPADEVGEPLSHELAGPSVVDEKDKVDQDCCVAVAVKAVEEAVCHVMIMEAAVEAEFTETKPLTSLQRDEKVTVRVLDGDTETFYRIRRTDAVGRIAERHATKKGFAALDLEYNGKLLDPDRSAETLPDLAALVCRIGSPSQRRRRIIDCIGMGPASVGEKKIIIGLRSPDLAEDDVFYCVKIHDSLRSMFKTHARRLHRSLASMSFFSVDGSRRILPSQSPANLALHDLSLLLCVVG